MEADGKLIEQTVKLKPDAKDGSVDISSKLDTIILEGKDIVAFEKLFYNGHEIAAHEDIDDEKQTVHCPEIDTTASEKDTGNKVVDVKKDAIIVDKVAYKNLVPDETYMLQGTLMDKETEKPLSFNCEKLIVLTEFKPEEKDGSVEVEAKLDTSKLGGRNLVVFEKLFIKTENSDVEVAKHEDIEDEGQTVSVKVLPAPDNPKTGLMSLFGTYVGLMAALMVTAGATYMVYHKRRKK